MNHKLKTWPKEFRAINQGLKTFEIRQNDRNFAAADVLILQEYDPVSEQYTGNEVSRVISYIVRGPDWGLPKNMVVMGLNTLGTIAGLGMENRIIYNLPAHIECPHCTAVLSRPVYKMQTRCPKCSRIWTLDESLSRVIIPPASP